MRDERTGRVGVERQATLGEQPQERPVVDQRTLRIARCRRAQLAQVAVDACQRLSKRVLGRSDRNGFWLGPCRFGPRA